ncbi:MAG: glycosyltransferase [Planctomycetes bacterium]|nr:glycosyltransferase [Planctomycetota bacterium]
MERKKKMLFIVTLGGLGGAQKNLLRSAMQYKHLGYEAIISAGEGGYLQEQAEALDIRFIKFRFLKRSKNPLMNFLFFLEASLLMKREAFDAIHFYSPNALFAGIAAKLIRKRCYTRFIFGGLSILDPMYGLHPMTRRIILLLYRALLTCIDEYIFENHSNKKFALDEKIVSHGTISIDHLLIKEKPKFLSNKIARSYFADLLGETISNKLIIGSIGRLSRQKNYAFLHRSIDASLMREKNAMIIIFGDGPERKKLIKESIAMGITDILRFPGAVNEASQYLRGFDLFLLPSLYEGTANVVIECLFAGMPILASDIPSNTETLNFSREQLFSLDDRNDFRCKIKNLITDPALRDRIGAQNHKLSLRYLVSKENHQKEKELCSESP